MKQWKRIALFFSWKLLATTAILSSLNLLHADDEMIAVQDADSTLGTQTYSCAPDMVTGVVALCRYAGEEVKVVDLNKETLASLNIVFQFAPAPENFVGPPEESTPFRRDLLNSAKNLFDHQVRALLENICRETYGEEGLEWANYIRPLKREKDPTHGFKIRSSCRRANLTYVTISPQ